MFRSLLRFSVGNFLLHFANFLFITLIIRNSADIFIAEFGLINSYIKVLIPFVGLSLSYYLLIADKKYLEKAFSIVFNLSRFPNLLCSIFFVLLLFFGGISEKYIAILLYSLALLKTYVDIKRNFYRAKDDFNQINKINLILSVSYVIAGIIASYGLIKLALLFLIFIHLSQVKYAKFENINVFRYKGLLKKTGYVSLTSVLSIIIYSSDIIILNFLNIAADVTSVYYTLTLLPINMLILSSTVLIFYFNDLKIQNYTNKKMLKIFLMLLLLNTPLVAAIFIFGNTIYLSIFNVNIQGYDIVTYLLFGGFLVNAIFRLRYSNFLIANKQTEVVFFSSAITAVINVILNFIMIPTNGAIGAAIASILAISLSTLYLKLQTVKYEKLHS